MYRRTARIGAAVAALCLDAASAGAQTAEAARVGTPAEINDRLRWELVTDGASPVGDESSATTGGAPTLTGTAANLLFRMDAQPLLDYAGGHAKRSRHAHFEVGFIAAPRAVTARPDIENSEAVEALTAQGATVGGTTTASSTLSRQRAFTAGAGYSDNYLFGAQGSGIFGEVGGVVRFNFDAYVADDRFFEKDGITYVKVPSDLGADAGYYRFEAAFRFRLSNGEMKVKQNGNDAGANVDDLLLIEIGYEYSGAKAGLMPEVSTQHRLRWRFLATPRLNNPNDTEKNKIKGVVGIEFDQDLARKGPKELRIFYGVNVNMEAIFKS
jgi:hypothetical protein